MLYLKTLKLRVLSQGMEKYTNVTAEELLTLWNDKDYIVELSKKYSTEKSYSFINGVLAKVIK